MSKKNALEIKLELKDKGLKDATGVLGKLFSIICNDLGITYDILERRIDSYIMNPVNGVPDNPKAQSSEKGNIMKDLAAADMTWRKFLKFARIMAPAYVRFEVHFGWKKPRNVETIHSLRVDMTHLKEYSESILAASEENEDRE